MNNSDENRRNLIDINRKVEDEIAAYKREKWIDLCGRLDPRKDYHHWRVINVLNNRCNQQNNGPTSNAITSGGYSSTTDRQTANLLAQHYEQASRLSFSREDRKQKKIYRQVLNQSKSYNQRDDFSNDITLEELDSVIRSLDPKRSLLVSTSSSVQ
ncbi:hypothetical protein TNCT_609131 [Trichonephila clavata]|uniref:Uncharacterized protein n=1 Tax=Trichonephila clavata TaxID=2740835 RepID=A0A8X6FW61_TRICU|nr:hypothetical protein TNCT_609131 [Trichonephila clavata]